MSEACRTRRDIRFVQQGKLPVALGIPLMRIAEIEEFIGKRIDANASLVELLTDLNEKMDLTDAEWTAAVFSIGYFEGANQIG